MSMLKNLSKRDLSILIGNTLDHFDTSLYGFLAPILAPIFFPKYIPIVQLILAYSIFASSLFTRPIGAFVFGVIAKRYGPVLGLSYSLIGVAVTTVCIGLIPCYATIGILAPIILILLRIIKDLFASGENTIAKLYIMEGKMEKDALLASHLYQNSTIFGIILASFVATLVSIFIEMSFLWRICFCFGGFTGLVGYILRCYSNPIENTKEQLFNYYKPSSLKSIWQHKTNIICIAITTAFSYITYTIPFIFMNGFVPLISDIPLQTMLFLNTFLLIFDMLLIFFTGRLLIRYAAHKVMILSSLILACTVVPLFYGLENASLLYITCVRCWIVILGVIFLCPLNYWYKQIFTTPDKYLLLGIGNALGTATIGHMTPAICFCLWHRIGSTVSVGVFIMFIAACTIYAIKSIKICH